MEHITSISGDRQQYSGGRIASQQYRQSMAFCMEFDGLEEGANRYDLLLLVKKLGKSAGFTPRMIHLLDYYMAFTRAEDWEEGSRPVVYQSLSRTALALGISERQVQKLEKALADVGAITWNDSGNHKRYGQRDPKTGRILYAFGVELTPLASLKTELENKLHEKQLIDAAWMETKRQISWHRSQIRSLIAASQEEGRDVACHQRRYDDIAIQIRTHLDLATLRLLLERHRTLYSELVAVMGECTVKSKRPTQASRIAKETHESSPRGELKFVHYKSTTQQPFNKLNTSSPPDSRFQDGAGASCSADVPSRDCGIDHVRIGSAINAASQRLRDHLPLHPEWPDMVNAASRIREELGISQTGWGHACQTLGRTGAALCILITDRAAQRDDQPARQPAAYFQGMINRAKSGNLHLHKSIFGLSKQNEVSQEVC
tara:strand:- start:27117 stop:28409 length:1293 start_codon:yes stop_codon:yes gene_type:complete